MKKPVQIVSVSGGPDSVYLARKAAGGESSLILAHYNHRARGRASYEDREFVERLSKTLGLEIEVQEALPRRGTGNLASGKADKKVQPGFEGKARAARYAFLKEMKKAHGAEKILLGHTADDQVETVLMRVLEGAGISGLKGIPRKTADGIERPLLDTWREDILRYLHKHEIPFRVDKSNFDTRFERNWVRNVLIPLLEKRYGKSLKKRIFALGERFREIDEFLETTARGWMKRNVKTADAGTLCFQRKPYGTCPSALRKKILQLLCFEGIGVSPNERLLGSMDRMIVSGGPSARQNIGKGAVLRIRYGEAILESARNQRTRSQVIQSEERGRIPTSILKNLTKGERAGVFDAGSIETPITVRPLKTGDRIRPFGLDAEKKVKEILIDRKVPREERWGRPVVCDAEGRILWIPGVVRSAHAPVTGNTRRTADFRLVLPR